MNLIRVHVQTTRSAKLRVAIDLQVACDDRRGRLCIGTLRRRDAVHSIACALKHQGVRAGVDRCFDAVGDDIDIAALARELLSVDGKRTDVIGTHLLRGDRAIGNVHCVGNGRKLRERKHGFATDFDADEERAIQ